MIYSMTNVIFQTTSTTRHDVSTIENLYSATELVTVISMIINQWASFSRALIIPITPLYPHFAFSLEHHPSSDWKVQRGCLTHYTNASLRSTLLLCLLFCDTLRCQRCGAGVLTSIENINTSYCKSSDLVGHFYHKT